jgi:hypothetical protein
MGKRWLCLILWTASFCHLQAQDADSLLLQLPNDSLLSYSDSLSIFYLIDSLLTMEENIPSSQLAIRLAYNSNVLYAGRTLGIDQFGLSPGISFYHKTGLYADVSGFWSDDYDPKYYLTILSAGYMHSFSSKFSATANYDRYFYNLGEDFIAYNNGLSISTALDLKPISVQCNYTYYFGNISAHRVMPSFSVNLSKKNMIKIEKITLSPGVYLLFGDQTFSDVEIIFPQSLLERIQNLNRYGTPYKLLVTESIVFGLMNYAFTLPLSVSHRNWGFYFSYTYNIPKALPGETLQISETGFIATGLTYYFNLKKPKSPF